MDPVAQHKKLKGKISIAPTIKVTQKNLAWLYTPGAAKASLAIAKKPELVYDLTRKWNTVAIVTDGTRVLGLGDVGPEASLPVMEGKAMLYKKFGGVDAIPLPLRTRTAAEFVRTVKNITPFFGGINLEDTACPKCFEVEEALRATLDIPVLHDDQYGTGTVALAALINALKIVRKKLSEIRIVIGGAGAAGQGIAKVLRAHGARHLLLVDSKGILYPARKIDMNKYKLRMARLTNPTNVKGDLRAALKGADVFIGVTARGNLLTRAMVEGMAPRAIIFALSNPDPEILPSRAREYGAEIVATGRSDFANQTNNSLVFPGLMRGVLDARVKNVSMALLCSAAAHLAALVKPTRDKILPLMSDPRVAPAISRGIARAAHGVAKAARR